MKKHVSHAIKCLGVLLAGVLAFASSDAEAIGRRYVTVGTASVTGVYYPAAGIVCRLFNRETKDGVRCAPESTGGSIYNLNALRHGELDMAIVQSDWQFHGYNGTALFEKDGPDKSLRSVFSLHSEPFTVLARKDSGINTFDDLKGKRVNIGNPGSGMRATMEILMDQKGWKDSDFNASELKASEQGAALCNNQIDVMIYAAGHPNGAIQEVTTTCETKLIPVEGADIDALLKKYPFYADAIIPGGMYSGNPNDIKTFGVKATFVTNDKMDEQIVYEMVKAVFSNFDVFKSLHPVFSTLTPEDMVLEGNTAPLHKGAERYYREAGLLKDAPQAAQQ